VDVDSQSLPNVQIIEKQEMHIRKSILMNGASKVLQLGHLQFNNLSFDSKK